jgi:hypothetical protein
LIGFQQEEEKERRTHRGLIGDPPTIYIYRHD